MIRLVGLLLLSATIALRHVAEGHEDGESSSLLSVANFLPPNRGGDLFNGTAILHPADWSSSCDPWNGDRPVDVESDYDPALDAYDNWTCPVSMRSVSGCGDFDKDTRDVTASCLASGNGDQVKQLPRCSDVRVINQASVLAPQTHVCFQHPIESYPNYGTVPGMETPPMLGRHRERWAKWGEYEYIPAQRWLHNAEHGGAIFLYHPCLSRQALCELRQYIASRPDDELYGQDYNTSGRQNAGQFRWILTPYADLRTSVAIATWGHLYMSNCLNEPAMDRFLDTYYRQAWEDYPPDGYYDYLYVSQEDATVADDCPAASSSAAGVEDGTTAASTATNGGNTTWWLPLLLLLFGTAALF